MKYTVEQVNYVQTDNSTFQVKPVKYAVKEVLGPQDPKTWYCRRPFDTYSQDILLGGLQTCYEEAFRYTRRP